MSTSGGMGKEMDMLVRQITTTLIVKRGERYSDAAWFVRGRIRFDLLRTCVIALRGHKKTAAPDSIRDLDFNLRPVAVKHEPSEAFFTLFFRGSSKGSREAVSADIEDPIPKGKRNTYIPVAS